MLGGLLLLALLLAQGVRANSHTAVLSALSLDEIGVPGFEAATTSYTHTVYDALNAPDEEITVAAVTDPEDDGTDGTPKAVIKPDDADGETDGHQVSLNVGENTIEIVVTSAGEETTRTYMVKVTRVAASDASLMALSLADPDDSDANIPLSPDFDAGTEMYTASVANSVDRYCGYGNADAHRCRSHDRPGIAGDPERGREHHQGGRAGRGRNRQDLHGRRDQGSVR
jgi:hypothetical protein